MSAPRFQIGCSKDGSIKKSSHSPIFSGDYAEAQALKWANENCTKHKTITLLKEDAHEINAGKFFLHRIIK